MNLGNNSPIKVCIKTIIWKDFLQVHLNHLSITYCNTKDLILRKLDIFYSDFHLSQKLKYYSNENYFFFI